MVRGPVFFKPLHADIKAAAEESVTKSPCASSSDEITWSLQMAVRQITSGSIWVKERLTLRHLKGRKAPRTPAKLSQQSHTAALASRLSAKTGNTAESALSE